MKLWVDDVRKAPEGYVRAKSVNEAKSWIESFEEGVEICVRDLRFNLGDKSVLVTDDLIIDAISLLIDIDHDAGDYASDGGDYIKLLDWLEETGRNYPIRIHSMNPVGVQNMRAIIHKNGWKEIK